MVSRRHRGKLQQVDVADEAQPAGQRGLEHDLPSPDDGPRLEWQPIRELQVDRRRRLETLEHRRDIRLVARRRRLRVRAAPPLPERARMTADRKSTRLNSSHTPL